MKPLWEEAGRTIVIKQHFFMQERSFTHLIEAQLSAFLVDFDGCDRFNAIGVGEVARRANVGRKF